jgi:hypothetical protein
MSSLDDAAASMVSRAAHGHFWDYDPASPFPGEDRNVYGIVTQDESLARLIVGTISSFQEDGLFLVIGWLDHDTAISAQIDLEDRYGAGIFFRYSIPKAA